MEAPEEFDIGQALRDYQRRISQLLARLPKKQASKHHLGLVSDDEKARIAVWVKDGTEKIFPDRPMAEKNSEARVLFRSYASHCFVGSWGTLSKGKIEEWFISDPPVLAESDPRFLCEMCRHIDFNMLLTKRGLPGNVEPGPTRITLHGFESMVKRANCAFCRMIVEKVKLDGVIDLTNEDELILVEMELVVIDEGPDTALQLGFNLSHHSVWGWPTQRIVIRSMSHSELPWSARSVSNIVDVSVLHSMIAADGTQSDSKVQSENSATDSLRFIDVNRNRVVQSVEFTKYACLSYCWGGLQQPTSLFDSLWDITELHEQTAILAQLPQTIIDAMELCRSLEIPYLWVDAYCVPQDDEQEKKSYIARMAEIFGNACLTLISVTNENPFQGIPGVSRPRSRNQIREKIQNMELVIGLNDHRRPVSDIQSAIWNSRAWTYQERNISQKLLYFTESQCVLVSSKDVHLEDVRPDSQISNLIDDYYGSFPDSGKLHMTVLSDPTSGNHPKKAIISESDITIYGFDTNLENLTQASDHRDGLLFDHYTFHGADISGQISFENRTFWDVYRQAVSEYTLRHMTSDLDAIHAFEGMMELMRQKTKIEYWAALPSCMFATALLWYPMEPLQRRKHGETSIFPSWSWAGWTGHCSYRGRGWYNSVYRGPVNIVNWCELLTKDEYLELFSGESRARLQQMIEKYDTERFASSLNPYEINEFNYEARGWKHEVDHVSNQHYYTHEAYPGVRFDVPIKLPAEKVLRLMAADESLNFSSWTTSMQFADITKVGFERTAGVHKYLQIGLNDESRSASHRPSWQRIVYHQGYRAGVITLNISFEDLDQSNTSKYRFVAISRDERPAIQSKWHLDFDKRVGGPVEVQYNLGFTDTQKERERAQDIPALNEECEPCDSQPQEDGDPHWDFERFSDGFFGIYNVLLLESIGSSADGYRRIGVGKIHRHAFHHAGASIEMTVVR